MSSFHSDSSSCCRPWPRTDGPRDRAGARAGEQIADGSAAAIRGGHAILEHALAALGLFAQAAHYHLRVALGGGAIAHHPLGVPAEGALHAPDGGQERRRLAARPEEAGDGRRVGARDQIGIDGGQELREADDAAADGHASPGPFKLHLAQESRTLSP